MRVFVIGYQQDSDLPDDEDIMEFVKAWRMKGPFKFVKYRFSFTNLDAYSEDTKHDKMNSIWPQHNASKAKAVKKSNELEKRRANRLNRQHCMRNT